MEHRFPWREQYLARTRLCYIDLGRLLSHAKRDRTARVPAYLQVELGDAIHLLFLDQGDPVNAATVWPDRREVVPLGGMLRMLAAEIERGEAGHVAFNGVEPGQLPAMFATIAGPPVEWAAAVQADDLDALFVTMYRRRADGVLEISGTGRSGYVCMAGGLARRWFFPEDDGTRPGPEALRHFVAACDDSLAASLHPPVVALPAQAPPGLVELYAAVLGGLVERLASRLPGDELDDLFDGSRPRRGAAETLAGFRREGGGVVPGETTASPEELTGAMGSWVTELAATGADRAGMDPADLLAEACLPHRFALEETGLLARLPWPLAWPVPGP